MKTRLYDHIDLRVQNVARAKRFYRPLMKVLGFTKESSNPEWTSYYPPAKGGELPAFFGFTRDPNHKPNDTRIAFWAASRAEVDRVARIAKAAGARNIEGPGPYDPDSPNYYAVFFEDPEGNRLEVCYRTPR
jgi:catechol 2,3-dioxygenase-like lactoylglutathione lyase family enzyme